MRMNNKLLFKWLKVYTLENFNTLIKFYEEIDTYDLKIVRGVDSIGNIYQLTCIPSKTIIQFKQIDKSTEEVKAIMTDDFFNFRKLIHSIWR